MLIPAIIVLGLVVLAGIWLGGLYMMVERPPDRLRLLGASHAVGGVIGFELLVLALRHTPPSAHAVKMGAAGFGLVSSILIGGALAIGMVILFRHIGRRAISMNIVAVHGLLAIVGYTLLITYLTMLH